jgi:hypothetical protein
VPLLPAEGLKTAMSDLRPYNGQRGAPLTTAARFIRGFRRIGIVAAVLVSLFGVTMTLYFARMEYHTKRVTFDSATCVANMIRAEVPYKIAEARKVASDGEIVDFLSRRSSPGCSRIGVYSMSLPDVFAIADERAPSFITEPLLGMGLVASGVSVLAVLLLIWSIGWLCAGFTRD